MNKKFAIIILLAIAFGILLSPNQQEDIKILRTTHSNYGKIWIYDTKKQRCLSFQEPRSAKSKQTCIFLQHPLIPTFNYHKMLLAGLYLQPKPQKVLMLGLGGGAIARQLQFILPHSQIDVVEINPKVIALAKEFFAFNESPKLKVVIADAADYVAQAITQQYDFIILDAFDDNYIPPKLLTENFILQLKSLLRKNGVLAINSFANSATANIETQLALNAFGEFYNLADNNRIILAMNGQLPELQQITQNATKWHKPFAELKINSNWLLEKFKLVNQN